MTIKRLLICSRCNKCQQMKNQRSTCSRCKKCFVVIRHKSSYSVSHIDVVHHSLSQVSMVTWGIYLRLENAYYFLFIILK